MEEITPRVSPLSTVVHRRKHYCFAVDADTGREVALAYPLDPDAVLHGERSLYIVAERMSETLYYDTSGLAERSNTLPLEDDEFDALHTVLRNVEAPTPLLSDFYFAVEILCDHAFVLEQVPPPHWWARDLPPEEQFIHILRTVGNSHVRFGRYFCDGQTFDDADTAILHALKNDRSVFDLLTIGK